MNRGIVLHTYIQTNAPIGKAVSFDQPPCLFLFHVQGFLVPVLVVTVWWLTVVVFLSDVWGFTWCCCLFCKAITLLLHLFCQAITLLLYLCTALYPVLYPSVPVICPGPAVWSGALYLVCSCSGCCSSWSCILVPVCCPVWSCIQHYRLNTMGIR